MFSDSSATGVSLSELFPHSRMHATCDIRVSSCCSDADLCQPGDLYVALIKPHSDGHSLAAEAVERGAAAILTERLLPFPVPQCLVADSSIAFAELCQRLAGNPANSLSVVGVAGHHGKTATQMMMTSVLEAAGHRPAVFGSLGCTDGSNAFPSASAVTSSSQYARWLAEIAARGCSHAVSELSRGPVIRHVFGGVPLRTLILSGLTTSTHRHAATPKTKTYVRRMLDQLTPDGLVVANIDCPVVRELVGTITNPVLTVSTESKADVTASRIEHFPSEQTFLLEAGQQTSVVRSKIIGDTHLQCCLLAIAGGLGAGVDLSVAVRAVESIQSIPGKLERVECGQPFSVFSDAATSANQLRAALLTLREITTGRLICVFGQGETNRPEIRALRGGVVERYADLGIITSDVVTEPEPLRVAHDVLDGYRKPGKAHVMPNRTRAIEWAIDRARPGDTVLLAGPHNRHAIRADDDFPADSDVARFCLFSRDADLGLDSLLSELGSQPSWN